MVHKIYIDDINTKLQTTLKESIEGYTTASYLIKKPSEATIERTVTVEDAALGKIFYLTIAGDLDEVGTYSIQAKIVFENSTYYSDNVTFIVYDAFT